MNNKANFLRKSDFYEGLLFLVFSIAGIIFCFLQHSELSIEWKLSPYLFPLFISVLMLLLSVSLIASSLSKKNGGKKNSQIDWLKICIFVAMCVVYYYVVMFLGFNLTTFLFLIGMFVLMGERKPWFVFNLSYLTTLVIWALFSKFLHVLLPVGQITYMLPMAYVTLVFVYLTTMIVSADIALFCRVRKWWLVLIISIVGTVLFWTLIARLCYMAFPSRFFVMYRII